MNNKKTIANESVESLTSHCKRIDDLKVDDNLEVLLKENSKAASVILNIDICKSNDSFKNGGK